MSNYYMTIDVAESEYYCISKQPNKLVRAINRLMKRGDSWKVVYVGDDGNEIRKYRFQKIYVNDRGVR